MRGVAVFGVLGFGEFRIPLVRAEWYVYGTYLYIYVYIDV